MENEAIKKIENQLKQKMQTVRLRFVDTLNTRIVDLDSLLVAMITTDNARNELAEIEAHAHKIHGISGSIGLSRLGALAAQLERILYENRVGSHMPDLTFVKELTNSLLDEMENVLEEQT